LLRGQAAGLDLLVLDAPHLFNRPGNPYTQPGGADWPDNAARFGALANIAAFVARGGVPGFVPDVLHCHDWQAGLALAYLRF
jgi:starch synthase